MYAFHRKPVVPFLPQKKIILETLHKLIGSLKILSIKGKKFLIQTVEYLFNYSKSQKMTNKIFLWIFFHQRPVQSISMTKYKAGIQHNKYTHNIVTIILNITTIDNGFSNFPSKNYIKCSYQSNIYHNLFSKY